MYLVLSKLPEVCVSMWHFDNAYTSSQTSAIHRTAKFPVIGFFVIDFYGFQIGCTVKASDCKKLAINHGQTHLEKRNVRRVFSIFEAQFCCL